MDLRLVHRLKGVVQLAFPVAVVLDTLHSLWRVRQLAAAQLKVRDVTEYMPLYILRHLTRERWAYRSEGWVHV